MGPTEIEKGFVSICVPHCFGCFKAKSPRISVEKDPFALWPEDLDVSKAQAPFDDSLDSSYSST